MATRKACPFAAWVNGPDGVLMSRLQELDAKALHDIMQPLNIIRLSCGNIRARMAGYSADDAEYLFAKLMRIEEQVVRAAELLQNLKKRNDDDASAENA
jgi:hypothetical protein